MKIMPNYARSSASSAAGSCARRPRDLIILQPLRRISRRTDNARLRVDKTNSVRSIPANRNPRITGTTRSGTANLRVRRRAVTRNKNAMRIRNHVP